MQKRGFGRVIFIVSNTFWRPPGAHMLAYIASKGALIGMVRALAVGLAVLSWLGRVGAIYSQVNGVVLVLAA
jgi:NAD(P)-dependent dehydrogenase (short-subunit alcohol dehydrogenase family)